jgi:hypothetical protein
MPEVNWIAIILAAASSLLVGFAWYSPALFNKAWMREVGMTDEKAKTGNMALIFGGAFALALVQCFCLAMFFGSEMRWQQTTFYGFLTGLGWVATAFGVQYLFERRTWTLALINGGYNIVVFTVYGLILGLVR